MSIQTNVDLGFPLRLFSLGCEPKPKKSINHHSKTDFLEDVENAVGEEVWNIVRGSPLGVIIRFVENKFTWSSKVVEHLLVNQLACKKKHEMWCLFGDTPARFSLSEFENITSLNCAPFVENEDIIETKVHKGLWKKLKVKRKSPCKKELRGALEDVISWSTEDKIRFTYLSILATIIIGEDDKKELPLELSRMVFDLPKVEKYPWGREAFKRLISSVKRVNLNANSYTLDGFVQALQVWAYSVVPSLGAKIGRPANIDGSPILKFRGLKGTNKVDIHIVSSADKENIRNVIINQAAPIVWEDKVVDKKVDALLEAIHKEGGLGLVTWVDHGTNIIRSEKNIENNDGEKSEAENEKINGKETSRKRKTEVVIASAKKIKALDSSVSVSSAESTEVIHMKMELEQQAKKVEILEFKLEEMGKQLKSYETMRLRIDLLEKEVMLLTEKSKTKEMFKVPHLKDEDISTDELVANVKAERGELAESDDESTLDGRYPALNIRITQPQKSSDVKIIQPTASVKEKITQKKMGQTLKVMGVDQAKVAREKSTRLKKPGPALQTPFRCILPNVGNKKQDNELNVMRGRGYDPFAPVETQKVKILDDWLQLDEEYPIGSQNNGVEFFKVLRTPQDWLNDEHINSALNLLRLRFMKNQNTFRSDRIAFIDTYFTTGWTMSYDEFLKAQDLPIFPNGAHEYCSGKLPAFAGTGKKWMVDVDYIYSVLFVNNNHWVALFISIPNRCIEVFDCGLKGSSNEQIVKAVKPIAHMLPHLLRASAPPSERPKMSVEQYKVRRPRQGIPQMLKTGDCGIYAIKFIECHALGAEFTTPISDENIKMVREKLAAEIFDETEQHGRTVSNPLPS